MTGAEPVLPTMDLDSIITSFRKKDTYFKIGVFLFVYIRNFLYICRNINNMWNQGSMDNIPTVRQVESIIKYMEESDELFYFEHMMSMIRVEPMKICLDLNNGHFGKIYDIVFDQNNKILEFSNTGQWIS